MASNLVETLAQELNELEREYASDFAGQSRASRDLSQIKRMAERATSLLKRIDQIPTAAQGRDLAELRTAVAQVQKTYASEVGAIKQAKDEGPSGAQFAGEATRANFVFARYVRHFAGQNRATRDVALLGEMVNDLKQIDKRMSAFIEERSSQGMERDREVVRGNLTMYQQEIGAIEEAMRSGTESEQASALAALANSQFAAYQAHFAGRARISRRPALIQRIIDTLKKTRERMIALRDAGLVDEFNGKNIDIVSDRLATYDNELAEIRKVRQGVALADIMGELGGAANESFEEYRKNFADKARSEVDLELLGQICDRLGEILRQMDELSWAEQNDVNDRNIEIVVDQLALFENEYEAVRALKAERPA